MARRFLLCKLNHGLRLARLFEIESKSPLELSAGSFFPASNTRAVWIGQALSERRCRISGVGVQRLGRADYAVQPTFGVDPVRGADGDSRSKGDTPDDFRAEEIHAAEPKEITKEAAAKAMREPPDYQIDKVVPDYSKPFEGDADAQRADEGKAFEPKTRKQKGTAQYQGDTKGTEKSGQEVEGQYGAGPDEGKTSRA